MRKGFTLLELMAVIVLIGVVAVVTVYRVDSVDRAAAKANIVAQNLNRIQAAAERFRSDKGEFPANVGVLVDGQYLTVPPHAPHAEGIYYIDPSNGAVSYASGS